MDTTKPHCFANCFTFSTHFCSPDALSDIIRKSSAQLIEVTLCLFSCGAQTCSFSRAWCKSERNILASKGVRLQPCFYPAFAFKGVVLNQ